MNISFDWSDVDKKIETINQKLDQILADCGNISSQSKKLSPSITCVTNIERLNNYLSCVVIELLTPVIYNHNKKLCRIRRIRRGLWCKKYVLLLFSSFF
jgi:hypothetical protein